MAWLLVFVAACTSSQYYAYTPAQPPPPTPSYSYILPSSTFLRGCASYGDDCAIVAQAFAGDRVQVLNRNDWGWAEVRLERTGTVGWLPGDLLSPSPLSPVFYVASATQYLRECGDYNCRGLELLHRGDRVEKLEQDARGWWRVRSAKSGRLGWLPAIAVSSKPGPPFYYVNVSSLALRAGPGTGHKVLATLSLNDQVEMLGISPAGWAQVRDVRRQIIGWCASRYLEAFPVQRSRK